MGRPRRRHGGSGARPRAAVKNQGRAGLFVVIELAAIAFLVVAGCSSGDRPEARVKAVIDDLAGQRFGTATARYRQDEEIVLSPAAAPAWRRGLEHQDATVREWSVDALARIGEPEDVPRVVAALDDPFRRVQEAAAAGLVTMDPPAARDAFVARLADPDPLRQMIAAQGLADLDDPGAVPPLVRLLEDPGADDAVRGVVAQSLGDLGDPAAVSPLAAVVADADAGTRLRRNAVEALAALEGEMATTALAGLVESDDEYIREVARRAIAARR